VKAILTYHSIDSSGSPISLDRETFLRHVRWLTSGAIAVVPLETLLRLPWDAKAVAVTFDDGFANFATEAAPALLEHGVPVTLFVVSDAVGGTNAWGGRVDRTVPQLPLLGWTDLGRLVEAGVTLGAHTRTHARLATLHRTELEHQVVGCAERIRAESGCTPRTFAYPYGEAGAAAAAMVRATYTAGVTTELRALRSGDDWATLPRIDAYYLRDSRWLDVWGTPRLRRYVWLRRNLREARRYVPTTRRAG
jgi:peptidoglycan/xylan/chitin deacetylase (PgdA/CDA1 family)